MAFEGKPLESIEEDDLQKLIEFKEAEAKKIEYKLTLPGGSDKERIEFLGDVSSFANAAGGHLVYGVKEDQGLPVELPGLAGVDPDAEILRLDGMAQRGIRPRIPVLSSRSIRLQNGSVAIVTRVPRSWASPHMVTYNDSQRFYGRNSAGKYQLDVDELRAGFNAWGAAAERIERWRADRLAKVVAGETPVALPGGKIILHTVPLSAVDPAVQFDVARSALASSLPPMIATGWGHRVNFDGLLTFERVGDAHSGYVQLFRNGTVEIVDSAVLQAPRHEEPFIPAGYELPLVKELPRYLGVQRQVGVEPPVLVMLTLGEVRGYRVVTQRSWGSERDGHPIDRDMLILPPILAERFDVDAPGLLRPAFNAVWNAAGWERSLNYDEHGKWRR